MIRPIVAYGDPVLREVTEEIEEGWSELDGLLADMYETMYAASGVGLAAPQIGLAIRLFIVDGSPFADDKDLDDQEREILKGFKKAFINPIIIEETGDTFGFEEGCLSIPGIREEVVREERVVIEYYNEKWELVEETYEGIAARIIQHEYDHIEGTLFTDHLSGLKKRMLTKKLKNISEGQVPVDYKMRFPNAKRGRR